MPTEVGIHVFVVPAHKDVDGGPSPAMTKYPCRWVIHKGRWYQTISRRIPSFNTSVLTLISRPTLWLLSGAVEPIPWRRIPRLDGGLPQRQPPLPCWSPVLRGLQRGDP